MLNGYIPIAVMMAAAAVLAIGMVSASAVLGPRHPTKYKNSPYECGMTPVGSARERFPIKFYLIAMLFIIFDIETIFLYPWAVTFIHQDRPFRLFLLAEMGLFVGILFVGYFYILGKGALDWDEGQEDRAELDPRVYARRAPIRFGNEDSGPVKLPSLVQTSPEDHFTAAPAETVHPPVLSGKA
jgi:NADH-quinone oxidoreductase subunit A